MSVISFVSALLSLVDAAAALLVAVLDDPISFLECRIRNLCFTVLAAKIEQSSLESLRLRFTIFWLKCLSRKSITSCLFG